MGPTKANGHVPGRAAPSRSLRRCAMGVPCCLSLLLLLALLGPYEILLEIWDPDSTASTYTAAASQSPNTGALEATPVSEELPEPEPIAVPDRFSVAESLSFPEAASASGRQSLSGVRLGGRAAGAAGTEAEEKDGSSGASGASFGGKTAKRFSTRAASPCLEDREAAVADVAVVLVGQLRSFEASGPSILRWLLTPPPHQAPPLEDAQGTGSPHSDTQGRGNSQESPSSRRSLTSTAAETANIGGTRSSSEGQSIGRVDGSSSDRSRGDGGATQATSEGTPLEPGGMQSCSRGVALSSNTCHGQCWFSMRLREEGTEGGARELLDLFVVTSLDENTFKLLGLLLPLSDPDSSSQVEADARVGPGLPEEAERWHLQRPPTLGFLSVAVLPDYTVDASKYPADKIRGLEHGPQFQMEAKALERVRAHERQQRGGRAYRWILKTRPDTFWSGPPPSLALLRTTIPVAGSASASGPRAAVKTSGAAARSIIYVPTGLDFWGINDRLALGPSEAMGPVFSRLSLLWHASRLWPNSAHRSQALNAELVLRLIVEGVYGHNTSVARARVPFCLLSRRDWVLMRSIAHPHPTRGGDYCRPCTPAQGNCGVCASKGDWETNWERLYDAAAGPAQASHRALLVSLPTQGSLCQQLLQQMQGIVQGPGAGARSGNWDAPQASEICTRRLLGPVQVVGPHKNPGASWPVAVGFLRRRCFGDRGCTIYSQGGPAAPHLSKGRRISPESLPYRWELMLLCTLGLMPGTEPLDPHPHATARLGPASASAGNPLSPKPHATGVGMRVRPRRLRAGARDQFVTLVSPESAQDVLRSVLHAASFALHVGGATFTQQEAEGVARHVGVADRVGKGASIWETMKRLRHTSLELLKLGADEVDAHVRSWHKWRRTPPVCQLLLHVGSRAVKQAHAEEQRGPGGRQVVAVPSGEPLAWETLVGWLRELGLLFDQCVAGTNEAQGRCLFFNPSQCSFA